MLKLPPLPRVALLIDADNISSKHIAKILQFSTSQGQPTTCRAYGDWEQPQLSTWRKKMPGLNIDPIQQDCGNNATDHRIFIEVCNFLHHDTADVYVIVSSDSGFTVLCEHIKQSGKQVIVIASKKSTSKALGKSRLNIIYIEDL